MTNTPIKHIVSITIATIYLTILNGCHVSSELERALDMAGNNRHELETVLNHYRTDSLKYQAAVFLIEHMPYQRGIAYEDTIRLYTYYKAISSSHTDPWILCDSIREADGQFNAQLKIVQNDICEISS